MTVLRQLRDCRQRRERDARRSGRRQPRAHTSEAGPARAVSTLPSPLAGEGQGVRGVSVPEGGRDARAPRRRRLPLTICLLIFFSSVPARATAPQAQQDRRPVPIRRPKPPVPEPTAPAPGSPENDETPLRGDWAPERLDAMLISPNSDSRRALPA